MDVENGTWFPYNTNHACPVQGALHAEGQQHQHRVQEPRQGQQTLNSPHAGVRPPSRYLQETLRESIHPSAPFNSVHGFPKHPESRPVSVCGDLGVEVCSCRWHGTM